MGEQKVSDYQQADAFVTSGFSLAQVVFGILAFLVALVFLILFPFQIQVFDELAFHKQPGLWPLISLVGMLIFGFFQVVQYWLNKEMLSEPGFVSESVVWVKALEYAGWFMAYVYLVPATGYLPTTLFFAAMLTWRLGYRSFRMIGSAVLAGLVIVVLFKSFLQVKIPGGAVYQFLPDATRNFMIQYL